MSIVLPIMKKLDGTPIFCDNCPVAGNATGELTASGIDMVGRRNDTVNSRHIVFTGENGGKSTTIAGDPHYSPEADVDRLFGAIRDCEGPETIVDEQSKGVWLFKHTEEVTRLACRALAQTRLD